MHTTGGTVTLAPVTAGVAINLGSATDAATDTLELSDAELHRITAGTLQIGNPMRRRLTSHAPINPAGVGHVCLQSGGAVWTDNANQLTVGSLTVSAGTGITLNTAVNMLTASGGAGDIVVTNAGPLTVLSGLPPTGTSKSPHRAR